METGMQQPYGRFDALIARHRQLIHNMCMRRADGNVGRCAELVQDCYIALWHYLPSLREEASHLQEAAWVAWQCRSVFSRRGKASPSLLPIDDYMAGPLVPDDDDPLRERIDAMAKVLTPHERHALELMAEGYSLGSSSSSSATKTAPTSRGTTPKNSLAMLPLQSPTTRMQQVRSLTSIPLSNLSWKMPSMTKSSKRLSRKTAWMISKKAGSVARMIPNVSKKNQNDELWHRYNSKRISLFRPFRGQSEI
ncbi:MAG: hypothetical protein IKN29_07090 [Bacteroidales bacterium]|nr:hypothetical protein [Bacteroidales bacterium]